MAAREPSPAYYHEDNLFPTRARMDEVHRPIVALAIRTLAGRGGRVLDLGCGNGALLAKICEADPRAVPFGIEIQPERVAHARLLLPRFPDHFLAADCFAPALPWDQALRFALVLVAPRRFQQAGLERAARLKAWLRRHCDALLVYGYGRALSDAGGLVALADEVGIALADSHDGVRASLAARY